MTIEIGKTGMRELTSARDKMQKVVGVISTHLPFEQSSGLTEGLMSFIQQFSDILDTVEIVESGRGRKPNAPSGPPPEDPRTPEQIAEDEALGLNVIL